MKRVAAMMAVLGVLALPAVAAAYPAPSGDNAAPNYCPPRPADESPAPSSTDENYLAQELADVCTRDESLWSTQSGQLAPLDGDLKDVKSAVNALTANGTTLDTLHGDLAGVHSDLGTLDADVKQLDADVKAEGSAPVQQVMLSPADRQESADIAGQLDGDLWIIVGAIIGCFAAGFILERFFPR